MGRNLRTCKLFAAHCAGIESVIRRRRGCHISSWRPLLRRTRCWRRGAHRASLPLAQHHGIGSERTPL